MAELHCSALMGKKKACWGKTPASWQTSLYDLVSNRPEIYLSQLVPMPTGRPMSLLHQHGEPVGGYWFALQYCGYGGPSHASVEWS